MPVTDVRHDMDAKSGRMAGVREGREAVSVRVRLPRLAEPVVRTVYVTD